jgi:hypothetical protein
VCEIETTLAGKHSRHDRTAAKQRCDIRLGKLMFLHQMAHYIRLHNRRPGDALLFVHVRQVGERAKIFPCALIVPRVFSELVNEGQRLFEMDVIADWNQRNCCPLLTYDQSREGVVRRMPRICPLRGGRCWGSAPRRTRTADAALRTRSLYPSEL